MAIDVYSTNFEEVNEVYIPFPNLPHPVFFFECAMSNEVLMMQHSEHCRE